MTNLPVITGFGGINPAGRSSGHHSYRRMIFDSLTEQQKIETQMALAALSGKLSKNDDGQPKKMTGVKNRDFRLLRNS